MFFRMESEHQKNEGVDNWHGLLSLILFFDLQRQAIFGGHDLQDYLRSKGGIWMGSEHLKTYDLIPHMTYFHWFNILTSRGRQILKVRTSRIIRGQKGVLEWNRHSHKKHDLIPHMTYFHWFNIWPFLEVIIKGRFKWRSDICVYISALLMW